MLCICFARMFVLARHNCSQDLDFSLNGEGADVDVKGVSLLLADAHKNRIGVRVSHNQPRTTCKQVFQSVAAKVCAYWCS